MAEFPDQEEINRLLNQSDPSELESQVIQIVRDNMKISANHMKDFWPEWTRYENLYRGFVMEDDSDKQQERKGRPKKLVVPFTFAQIQTAASFILSSYQQRRNLFELEGRGPEDIKNVPAMERDLAYQVQRMRMILKLYAWIIDSLRYGFGVVKCSWKVEHRPMRVRKSVSSSGFRSTVNRVMGMIFDSEDQTQEEVDGIEDVLYYEGNFVDNVSPFAFYPDPNVTLARFQEGSFVGHEEVLSRASVEQARSDGRYHGTKHIRNGITRAEWDSRERPGGIRGLVTESGGLFKVPADSVILNEMQLNIVPKEFTEKYGVNFGDEDYPVKVIATLANDNKLIQLERAEHLHGQFTYALAEYSPDSNSFFNPGLAGTIEKLQDLINWFYNSHVAGVSRAIQNRLIVNRRWVEMSDLTEDRNVIRTKSGEMPPNLDSVVKQLQVVDVTRGHVVDADALFKIMQIVSGVNENALGQYAAGRRSATESRNVNAGAAARLKMHATLQYFQGMEPLAEQMLANTRQWRSEEVFSLIQGSDSEKYSFEEVILSDPDTIAGGYDFIPFDATLPSEKGAVVHQLSELFKLVLEPGAAQALDLDPKALLDHIMTLLGIHNLDDFRLSTRMGPPQVVPDEEVEQGMQNGTMTPADGEALLGGLMQR